MKEKFKLLLLKWIGRDNLPDCLQPGEPYIDYVPEFQRRINDKLMRQEEIKRRQNGCLCCHRRDK